MNWLECRPGFHIPRWMDCEQFPAFDDWDPELPAFSDVVHLGAARLPSPYSVTKWRKAQFMDWPLEMDAGIARVIAAREYDAKRFVYLVPAWRRQLIDWITEIDDIEDQVSTIAWLAEIVLAKFIPIPRSVLSAAQRTSRLLDDAQKVLGLGMGSRRGKSDWHSKRRELAAAKRGARTKLARLIIWFKDNWGHLLEAGQATNTWFDVGIVLGPIMGFIEDGLWTAGKKTLDNYLIAADALMPGIRESYWEHLRAYGEAIDDRWDELYEQSVLVTTDTLEALLSPDAEPFLDVL